VADDDKVAVSYYDKLKSEDLVQWARPLIERAGYKVRFGDGKLVPDTSMHHDTPWHHTVPGDKLDCGMHMTITHNVVFKNLGVDWVPAFCQECWKVVVRPKTLLALFALENIQLRMKRNAKCGIEVRESVHGLYGGYFYNTSLESGRECHAAVREAVDAEPLLGPDTVVLLKRGCTEYEMEHGDSSKWKVTPAQEHVEEIIHRLVVSNTNFSPQPPHLVTRVHRRWIEFAYAAGDETYKHFTGGKPLYPAYVTYHDEPSREDNKSAAVKKKAAASRKRQTKGKK
jgi:hypothetical protein